MSDGQLDPVTLRASLEAWLDEFVARTAETGGYLFYRNAVANLSYGTDGRRTVAAATVQDGVHGRCRCELVHEPGAGWSGDCSCLSNEDCAHLYAAGRALAAALHRPGATPSTLPPLKGMALERSTLRPERPERPAAPPDEQALVARFTAQTGAEPDQKQRLFLRQLLDLHRALRSGSYNYRPYALANLAPPAHRARLPLLYQQPFTDHWAKLPTDPLELWSHVALIFTDAGVPLPEFMLPLTDVEAARRAIEQLKRERELERWRTRFAELERSATGVSGRATGSVELRRLRLRLGPKRMGWEISVSDAGDGEPKFQPLPGNELREVLDHPEGIAMGFDAASTVVLAFLRAHKTRNGRTTPRYEEPADRELLGRLLVHPHASACVVDADGRAIIRDDRRLVWRFEVHPTDQQQLMARLGFADGSPAPEPLLHLPGPPDHYLHGRALFAGMPPPVEQWASNDPTAPTAIPRAALALPEAQRFAVRAGLALPEGLQGQFRSEPLRARLRAWLAPRHAGGHPSDEVVFCELGALAEDGTVRAILMSGEWRSDGPGVAKRRPDDAFRVLDFEPTQPAQRHFERSPLLDYERWRPAGACCFAEITTEFERSFPEWLRGFPTDTLVELAPELAAFLQPATRAHYALDVAPTDETSGIDWFDVQVKLRVEDTTLTAEEIALLTKAQGAFVRLPGRGWRRLDLASPEALNENLGRLGLDLATAAAESAREPLRFHALQLADEKLQEALPQGLRATVRDRAAALRTIEPPAPPAALTAELRPYQREGFHFLAHLAENRFGGVLADDMGLGKTLQALAWLLWLADRPRGARPAAAPLRALIVCPKSVVVNWQLETTRFAPGLRTALLDPRTAGGPIPSEAHLVVINYAQLRLHATALSAETWDAVVLDEAQNIKNPASVTAQAARALPAAHRLVLTGTPIENRLLDLWSLFAFAQPGLLGGQTAFRRLYNDKADPTGARARLAVRVKHFLLRRTKGQVARDLPPRIEEDLVCELEGRQRALYDAELKRARQLVLGVKSPREFDAQRFNILQSLLRLRQICCDPRLVSTSIANAEASSAKLDALLETVESVVDEGHRVLVFSQFVTMLDLIRAELNSRQVRHLILTGKSENRQALVDEFQSPDGPPVFLLSLKAAGSGLNLTAASYVVLFDPWWNPAVEAQAIDRTHRIGQRNQVIAYRLLARNTIEEKIRLLQREKAALAASVVQEESLAKVMDLESLRQILG